MTPGRSDDPWTGAVQLVFRCGGVQNQPAGFSGLSEHASTKESGILGKRRTSSSWWDIKSRLDCVRLDWTPLV